MYEELCKRLRAMWDGEGGPANEAAEVIEQLEAKVELLETKIMALEDKAPLKTRYKYTTIFY